MYDAETHDAQFDSPPRRTTKRGAGRTKTKSSPKRPDPLTRSDTLDTMLDTNGDGGGGMHSLAHELAAALMPEPSPGSKPLADELGLEFEEGAEGIDEQPETNGHAATEDDEDEDGEPPLTPELEHHPHATRPSVASQEDEHEQRPWNPLTDLSNDMQTMDIFVSHLRRLDGEYTSTSEPVLEKAASQLIRRLNDTVRERENQVRQLLELEREFRRISGEIGGDDVLGSLDELEAVEGLLDPRQPNSSRPTHSRLPSLNEADEDEWERASSISQSQGAPEMDGSILSPISPSFPKSGFVTPSSTIPLVAHFRSETKSLASSLTSLSEQTQVNGAATADAGRKIRALKNKVITWQAEMESAERSRERIASWERSNRLSRRVTGRDLAEEQLSGFRLSLEEAAIKANAIMAAT
jgi:hypothetical protein